MNRQQLLQRLDRAWLDFKASYEGLTDGQMTEPGVAGPWSVRDVIAHVTTWESEALTHLPTILAGRKPPTYRSVFGGIDAFNAQSVRENASLPLGEVLRQQEKVHRQLVRAVEEAPETTMVRETPWRRRLRLDTYAHYRTHAGAIRRWRERTGV